MIAGSFNAGNVLVGTTSSNDLVGASDVDETTAGIYLVEQLKAVTSQSVTASNVGGTVGSATIIVEYLVA